MNQLTVSCSPHFSSKTKTRNIMLDVIIALSPLVVMSFLFYGYHALITLFLSVASCVAGEYLYNLIASKGKDYKKLGTIKDLSAVVTGIILALNLPATLGWHPEMLIKGELVTGTYAWYVPVLGGLFCIMVVKMLFGGIGKNVVNPALAGRIFLFVSFTSIIAGSVGVWPDATAYENGFTANFDSVSTGATMLPTLKAAIMGGIKFEPESNLLLDLFLGKQAGSMGETSVLALLIGYGYLVFRRVIDWKGPAVFIGSAAIFLLLFGAMKGNIEGSTISESFDVSFSALLPGLMSGGLIFGAIFMATDYATSPNTMIGNIIYFAGCGFFTALLRMFGSYPEGVSFAILFMNCLVPLIDKYIVPKPFGYVKPVKPAKEAKA